LNHKNFVAELRRRLTLDVAQLAMWSLGLSWTTPKTPLWRNLWERCSENAAFLALATLNLKKFNAGSAGVQ